MRKQRLIPVFLVVTLGLVWLGFSLSFYDVRTELAVALQKDETTGASEDETKRDFMFQINGYETDNQGRQTLNMYFHYRYEDGIAESDIPNYEDLRSDATKFMDEVDASENPFWETLNQELCSQLKSDYPIQAISCQLQVYPNVSTGVPFERCFHGSIHTIGDIDLLALPGPIGFGGS